MKDNDDWIDEFLEDLEDVNEIANGWQIGIIEQLMLTCPMTDADKFYLEKNLCNLTMIEANQWIEQLREVEIPRDPKDQYEKMRKNGVFN